MITDFRQMEKTQAVVDDVVIQFADELFRWALYRTSNHEIAQDLVQDTYFAAIKSRDSFQNRSKVKTWLFSILNNKIIDHHRKEFKRIIYNQSELSKDSDGDDILGKLFDRNGTWKNRSNYEAWEETEEHLLDNVHFRKSLQSCLENLPEKWFSAVQMKYLEEKDSADICKELDISPSNFWQILHRSKLKLKNCLGNNPSGRK